MAGRKRPGFAGPSGGPGPPGDYDDEHDPGEGSSTNPPPPKKRKPRADLVVGPDGALLPFPIATKGPCDQLICTNADHWRDAKLHDGDTCELEICGSTTHHPGHHFVISDPRLPVTCEKCGGDHHTAVHDELQRKDGKDLVDCDVCGGQGHLPVAHEHPCRHILCLGHFDPTHQHDYIDADNPKSCGPLLALCGSVNHSDGAHLTNDVRPLFCTVCGSSDHASKQHDAAITFMHNSGDNACGHVGHNRIGEKCLFRSNDLRQLTPKQTLERELGPDAENATVVMALQAFTRLPSRRKHDPVPAEGSQEDLDEDFAIELLATIDDAERRTTRLMATASLFLDLLFKHCRDSALPFPEVNQTLLWQIFIAVSADSGGVSHATVRYVKEKIWDPLVAALPAGTYQRTSRDGLTQILQITALQHDTIALNHVNTNLRTRVRNYVLTHIRLALHAAGRYGRNGYGRKDTQIMASYITNSLADWDPREHGGGGQPTFTIQGTGDFAAELRLDLPVVALCNATFEHVRDEIIGEGRYLHPYWVKSNWQKWWSPLFRIQCAFETWRAQLATDLRAANPTNKAERRAFYDAHPIRPKQVKAFNILPIYTTEAKFITIERQSLHHMISLTRRRLGMPPLTEAAYKAAEKANPLAWWGRYFRPELVTTFQQGPLPKEATNRFPTLVQRAFYYSFATNGIQASVHVLTRPREREPEPRYPTAQELIDKTIVAGDPGRDVIVDASCGAIDDTITKSHVVTITNAEYYHEAGYTEQTRKLNVRKKRDRIIREIESQAPLAKPFSFMDTIVHLRYSLIHLARVTAFYGTRVHRRSRLSRYIGKHRAQEVLGAKFLKATGVRDARDLVVGFGAAKFRHNSRGSATGPSSSLPWLKRFLRRYGAWITPDVDEHNTSQTCPSCTGKVAKRTHRGGHYRVKDCKNPNCLTKCWNRDVMAATNIRTLIIWMSCHGRRPSQFRPRNDGGPQDDPAFVAETARAGFINAHVDQIMAEAN